MTWDDVRERIARFATLPDNLDDGGKAMTCEATEEAYRWCYALASLDFPAPTMIALTSDGQIEAEWEAGRFWLGGRLASSKHWTIET